MTRTINFTVAGEPKIHCASCEQRISNALRRLAGIQDVQASAQTQQVSVTVGPTQVSQEQVRAHPALAHLVGGLRPTRQCAPVPRL